MFADRAEAGRRLAGALGAYRGAKAVVLALPRGGVPVGHEIARALGLPLDLMLVRKVGLPWQKELAVGAVAGPAGEELLINRDVAEGAGLSDARIRVLAAEEREELERRRMLYLGDRPVPGLEGLTVILADDGAATGATMRAAILATRRLDPGRIVVAVPVASREALALLREEADEVACLEAPEWFEAVGAHYGAFPQVGDDEVRVCLAAGGGGVG